MPVPAIVVLLTSFVLFLLSIMPDKAHSAEPLKLCTGGTTGYYFRAGKEIKKFMGEDLAIINTNGSIDNLNKLKAGECDAAIAQADAYVLVNDPSITRLTPLYKEAAHFYCNKASGIDDIEDLTAKHRIAIGQPGSGGETVWLNFVKEDNDYGAVPIEPVGGDEAYMMVADGSSVTCGIFIAAPGVPEVKEALENYGDRIVLVDATDSDFNDATDPKGNRLYTFDEIDSRVYGTRGDIDTVFQDAILFTRTPPHPLHKQFLAAVSKARPGILALVGQR